MSGTDKEGGGVAEAVLMRKRLYKFLIGFVVSVAVSIMLLIALIWSVAGNKVRGLCGGISIMLLIALIWSVGNKVRGLCGGISIMLLIALNGPWVTRYVVSVAVSVSCY